MRFDVQKYIGESTELADYMKQKTSGITILKAPTGSGKTTLASELGAWFVTPLKTLSSAITNDRKHKMVGRMLEREYLSTELDGELIVFDEAHMIVPALSYRKSANSAIDKINKDSVNNHVVLLSGTWDDNHNVLFQNPTVIDVHNQNPLPDLNLVVVNKLDDKARQTFISEVIEQHPDEPILFLNNDTRENIKFAELYGGKWSASNVPSDIEIDDPRMTTYIDFTVLNETELAGGAYFTTLAVEQGYSFQNEKGVTARLTKYLQPIDVRSQVQLMNRFRKPNQTHYVLLQEGLEPDQQRMIHSEHVELAVDDWVRGLNQYSDKFKNASLQYDNWRILSELEVERARAWFRGFEINKRLSQPRHQNVLLTELKRHCVITELGIETDDDVRVIDKPLLNQQLAIELIENKASVYNSIQNHSLTLNELCVTKHEQHFHDYLIQQGVDVFEAKQCVQHLKQRTQLCFELDTDVLASMAMSVETLLVLNWMKNHPNTVAMLNKALTIEINNTRPERKTGDGGVYEIMFDILWQLNTAESDAGSSFRDFMSERFVELINPKPLLDNLIDLERVKQSDGKNVYIVKSEREWWDVPLRREFNKEKTKLNDWSKKGYDIKHLCELTGLNRIELAQKHNKRSIDKLIS